MDRRQQKTRKAILEAFSELLTQKSYSRITVQDIIDEANIGRTTFYAHFETKDALLEDMIEGIFDHVFADTLYAEETHDFSLQGEGAEDAIAHILYHLLDRKKNIEAILRGESGEMFFRYLRHCFEELLPESVLGNITPEQLSVPEDFFRAHLSNSFIGAVQWWMKDESVHTPEEVARYYLSMVMPILPPVSRHAERRLTGREMK